MKCINVCSGAFVRRGGRLRLFLPESFGRLHLRRLQFEHFSIEYVAKENLTRDQYGRESCAQRNGTPPELEVLATQEIPSSDPSDQERAGKISGGQHMGHLIYLALGMHREEGLRAKGKDKKRIAPMILNEWEDAWKE
jgi:hypothetical protein